MLTYLLVILITAYTVTSFYSKSQSLRSRHNGIYQMSPSKKINSKAIKSNMKLDKYHNATIYQLVCSDKNATLVYIGHTTNFKTRMSIHKYECNHKEGRNFNLPLYKYMRANGGCDNWEMIALERCRDKEEALRKEREWILKTPLAINKGRPLILNRLITKLLTDYARKRKEAQQKSKKEYDKEYRATRRLLLKSNTSASNEDNQYMRLYRQENKGAVSGYNKKYQDANKEKIYAQRKQKLLNESDEDRTKRNEKLKLHRAAKKAALKDTTSDKNA